MSGNTFTAGKTRGVIRAMISIVLIMMLSLLVLCFVGCNAEEEFDSSNKVKYTLTYDTNGGTDVDESLIGVNVDGTLIEPYAPTKEDYVFGGWFCGDALFDFENTIPTTDTTLKAMWYDFSGGENVQVIDNLEYTYETSDYSFYVSGIESYTQTSFTVLGELEDASGVKIPMTQIGYYAFYSSSLTSIDLPSSVTTIGERAFSTSEIESIDLSYITTIGANAFNACDGLVELTVPNNVKNIGDCAFSECDYLEKITFESGDDFIIFGVEGQAYEDGRDFLLGCDVLTTIEFGNRFESIPRGSFYRCYGLVNVTIPNTVTQIGYRVFYQCSSLETLIIPASVEYIDNNGIYDNSKLTIYIDNTITFVLENFNSSWNNSYSIVFYIGEWEVGDDGIPSLIGADDENVSVVV